MRIKLVLILGLVFKIKSKIKFSEKFKRRIFGYSPIFNINGAKNLNWNPVYRFEDNYPDFQIELHKFKSKLENEIKSQKSVSYLKFGDGDYYFLKGQPVGSATPGKRAISRELTFNELSDYQTNSKKVDNYLCEIDFQNRKLFKEIFNVSDPIPAEFVYGLTANHWLTQLPFKIGIIGADKKIEIIRQLMKFQKYQNYLGLKEFTDYVKIPQKFACDDLNQRLIELDEQLRNSEADLFLVGVGHLKSGIMCELTKMKNAVYLDIGSGIDALAGLIDAKRPYFGSWVNHRIRNDDLYQDVDLLQYESNSTQFLN
jgi:hypothetical protein